MWQMGVPMSSTARRIAQSVCVCALVIALGVTGLAIARHESPFQLFSQALIPDPQQVFGKNHLLVLVVGLDYDYDTADTESSKTSRSDIIKAVNLDFKTKKVYILSVPRDMDAILPSGQEAKINQAQSEGGIKESRQVIAEWLGIPSFDRYVILRIDSMADLINAIGGVDLAVMNSDALRREGPNGRIDYDDNWGHLHVHLKPGMQHMNGAAAVGYARFRHDWCSDPCRIMRQDQVVAAIVARLKNDRLNTLEHLSPLAAVVHKDVETSLTPGEELSLVSAFSGISPADIKTAQVPYIADKNVPGYGSVIVPDTKARAALVASMLLGLSAPVNVRINVLNGTSTAGAAKRVADLLKTKGFTVARVGNAAARASTAIYAANQSAGAQVRAALGPSVNAAPILEAQSGNVTVIVGQDLAGALNPDPVQQ